MKAKWIALDHPDPVTDHDLPDADVVIATWWETAFSVSRLSPTKGQKFYFVQHHEVHEALPNHISAGSYHLPLKKITIARWLSDTMAHTYGDTDTIVVPNSVDQSLFHAKERGRQANPTIGLMYSPVAFKGVDTALRAIEHARKSVPDVHLVAFGASPPGKQLGLPPETEFHLAPKQEEIRNIYASCDVFLAASRVEGFGLPILEAMACRTPVVATRTGCAPDVIVNGVNGYLADVEDWELLAEGLIKVLSLDDALWRTLSQSALEQVEQYSWDDATKLFEAALLEG
ncbi:Glycosyl transferases group 1 [Aliiruegeria lutimaris]|uniref:Glycosyl transferases group 1 n=2 Tax=Aliiruegeria lutimaris TaxID=571298 RepID=A0A1G9DV81_9RHOB|nr:Glycosyl transferases group 1 [Aliiruegeria lutimaris]